MTLHQIYLSIRLTPIRVRMAKFNKSMKFHFFSAFRATVFSNDSVNLYTLSHVICAQFDLVII